MSVDRLQELRRRKKPNGDETAVEMQSVPENATNETLQHGDNDVDVQMELYRPINSLIEDIVKATQNLQALQGRDNKTTDDKSRKKIMAEMSTLNAETMSKANSVKDALMQIKQLNDDFEKEEGNANSARSQVRNNLYQSTCRRFQLHMAEFTQAREDFRQNVTDRMARQIKIVDPTKTDEQARDLIEKGQAEQIITKALASDNLKEVVAELRARNQELIMLQANVESLYEMFKDLYNLIEMNGEAINVIEQRVARSLDYVQRGEAELVKAKHHQKKAGKLKCILLLILLVVFIIVLTPILITSGVGKKEAGGEAGGGEAGGGESTTPA